MDFRLIDKSTVHPKLMRFVGYCENLAGDGKMPPSRGFFVRNAPWLFGFISTAEVLDGGADYRYSYVGDFWKAMLNYDISHTRISELESCGRFPNVRSNYDAAVRERVPRYRMARMSWPDGKIFRYERLVVPFADENGNVNMLAIAAQSDQPLTDLMAYRGGGEATLALEITAPIKKSLSPT